LGESGTIWVGGEKQKNLPSKKQKINSSKKKGDRWNAWSLKREIWSVKSQGKKGKLTVKKTPREQKKLEISPGSRRASCVTKGLGSQTGPQLPQKKKKNRKGRSKTKKKKKTKPRRRPGGDEKRRGVLIRGKKKKGEKKTPGNRNAQRGQKGLEVMQ